MPDSEDTPLLGVRVRPTWISVVLLLIFQVLILVPGETVMATLSVQFVRCTFARQRNFTLPADGNACVATNTSRELTEIQSETALFSTYQSFLTDLIPVLTGLPLIAVSDFTGRRPIFILSCLGPLVMAATFLLVSFLELSVYYTLIGSAVYGCSGGFVLLSSISLLYATDIVHPKKRAVALAAIYSIQYIVVYLAPLILNSLLGVFCSFTIIYAIIGCFALLALLWMLPPCIIQESTNKKAVDFRNLLREIPRDIKDLFVGATEGRRWRLVLDLICSASFYFVSYGFQNTVNLYALGQPFCWTPSLVGTFALWYGVPNATVAPFAVWFFEKIASDYWILYLSTFCGVAQYLITATATTNEVLIYGATLGGLFYGISQPVFVSLMTKLVAQRSHGALFSMYVLVVSSSCAVSLVVESYTYALVVQCGHAVDIFFVMAGITGLVFIPTIVMHVLEPKDGFQPNVAREGSGIEHKLDRSTHNVANL